MSAIELAKALGTERYREVEMEAYVTVKTRFYGDASARSAVKYLKTFKSRREMKAHTKEVVRAWVAEMNRIVEESVPA